MSMSMILVSKFYGAVPVDAPRGTSRSTVQGHLDGMETMKVTGLASCGLWKGYGAEALLGLCCILPKE